MIAADVDRSLRRRMSLLPLPAALLLAGAGYVPTVACAGHDGVLAMGLGLLVVTAAVYATLLPAMVEIVRIPVDQRLKVGFAAALQRFLFTLLFAGLIAMYAEIHVQAFLLWIAISYVIMIKVETYILLRWMK